MTAGSVPDSVNNLSAGGYWHQARQPLTSLVFVTPLLVAYEAGVILLGPDAMRNGAEVWLRTALNWVGFGEYFLLPILTVSILLGWHYTTRQPWRVAPGVFYGMTVESALAAYCLQLLLQLQGRFCQAVPAHLKMPAHLAIPAQLAIGHGMIASTVRVLSTAIGYLGAGIYEELLFRVVLLSLVIWGLRGLKFTGRPAVLVAMVATSLLFSAAHYLGANGESIAWFTFLFRFLAGMFFAAIFVYRGFGIAVGAHAGYDLLVGLRWC